MTAQPENSEIQAPGQPGHESGPGRLPLTKASALHACADGIPGAGIGVGPVLLCILNRTSSNWRGQKDEVNFQFCGEVRYAFALPNAYQIELGRRDESVVRCVGDQAKTPEGYGTQKIHVFGPEYHRASPLPTFIHEPGLS